MGIDTITLALIFSILGIGTFISFRILNITDLTIEASFAFGAVIAALLCKGGNIYVSLLCAFLGGCAAGLITGLLHTKLKINAILSGILTLTAFYSINLMVSNENTSITLRKYTSAGLQNNTMFSTSEGINLLIMTIFIAVIVVAVILFFKTKIGMSIRACGDNEQMTKTQCISTDLMKIIGLMISNGFVALSGALVVHFNGSYSTDLERGMMVVGVATIIIGELIVFKKHDMWLMLIGIIVGSIIYRIVYVLILQIDAIKPIHLQLIQSIFLILIIVGGVLGDKTNKLLKLNKAKKLADRSDEDGDLNA